MKSLRHVWLFATLWTVAHQAPPSMGFSRQEYWSGLPFPSPEDLPDPGIKPRSPTLQADALTSEPPGKPYKAIKKEKSSDETFKKNHLPARPHPLCFMLWRIWAGRGVAGWGRVGIPASLGTCFRWLVKDRHGRGLESAWTSLLDLGQIMWQTWRSSL